MRVLPALLLGIVACGSDAAGTPSPPGIDSGTTMPTDASVAADAPSTPVDANMPPPSPGVWSMGYYAGYQASLYPVASVEWSGLTHIAVAFYLPHTDGSLDETLFLDATRGPALAQSIVTAAHAHGVKAIASIGGAGSGPALEGATSSGAMATFVANLAGVLTKYGYDGLDIDWEPLTTTDQAAAIAVANQVRAAHPGAIMTMPVGYLNANSPGDLTGYPKIAAAYDQVNVMSYGMSGAYSGWKSWHSSPMYFKDTATPTSIDDSVGRYVTAGVPKAKLGFGIGFYGLCYSSPVTAPDQALGGATVVADDNTMSFTNITAKYLSPAARQYDAMAKVPYLTFASPHAPDGCTFVSYDDAQSIADKGAYLKAQGLGGVIVWTINQGVVGNASPLLDAIHDQVLH